MKNIESKLAYFFPTQGSYSIIGYENNLTSLDEEYIFLIMNSGISTIYGIKFTINDILRKYFKMFDNDMWHKIVVSSNIVINFNSTEWKNKDFILNLSNVQFSGSDVNNVGKIELFNIKNKNQGIILKYRLFCYLYQTTNKKGYTSFVQEFVLEEYKQDSDAIRLIASRREEDYCYIPEENTIFDDMLNYIEHLILNYEYLFNVNYEY